MKALIEIKNVSFRKIGDISLGNDKAVRDCVEVFESYKVITFLGLPVWRLNHTLNDWNPSELTSKSHTQD